MARLEDLTAGSVITGILANEPITVVSTKWYGTASMEVYYKTNQGTTGSQILYREDEPGLTVLEKTLPWSFDVKAGQMRLVSEAYRIHLAHIFDPYLAVHTSAIEPLPHQISAVYEDMLPRLPLRYVLADDPGAGKTIMTGLLLKELIIRGDLKRCMVVCPGNLAEQWQDELYQKFHLRFEILTNDRLESAVSGNVFTEINYCIMPNHVHLLLLFHGASVTVSRVIQQMKGVVRKRANRPIWHTSFHDRIVRDEREMRLIWNYIDNNPGKWLEDRYYRT